MNDSFAQDIQSPIKTPPPHSNQPKSNQQNDQHVSQPESIVSVSQYFAPIQAEFDEECDNFGKHVRQDCDKFTSIQKEIIELSDALADQLLTKSKLQEQLKQAKEDKAAQLSLYGLEMTAAGDEINTMKSKLDTLRQQIRGHYHKYLDLGDQGAKKEAEEYKGQHIIPLELQRDELAKDIEHLESKDRQIVSINQEIDKNSKSIEELENTLKKLMRDLRLKAGASYLDNINKVLALKAEIVNLNQVILKMRDEQRDELIQKEADIAAVREDMKAEMKKQADQFTVQTTELADQMKRQNEQLNAEILAIRAEMKQQSGQFRARDGFQQCQDGLQNIVADNQQELNQTNNQLKEAIHQIDSTESQLEPVQFPSSLTLNSMEELLHIITATQDSLVSLTSLDLSKCKLGDMKTAFFKALFKMPNLTSLNLNGSGIGVAGAKVLASSTLISLTSLDLGGNRIGDAGAEALAVSATLTNLTSLDLAFNNIGVAGAKALAASATLTNLISLNLGGNNIGDAGAEALAASTTLTNITSLDLGYNNIGAAGAEALAASATLTNITSLNLYANKIGAAGAEAIRIRYPFVSL